MSSQIAGFVVATPTLWRLALIASAGLAALQLIVSPVIIESPVWLQTQSRNGEVDGIYTKLYHGLPPREGAYTQQCLYQVLADTHRR
jgi:SP family facilitated glucose transporter-like MFS transporter 3